MGRIEKGGVLIVVGSPTYWDEGRVHLEIEKRAPVQIRFGHGDKGVDLFARRYAERHGLAMIPQGYRYPAFMVAGAVGQVRGLAMPCKDGFGRFATAAMAEMARLGIPVTETRPCYAVEYRPHPHLHHVSQSQINTFGVYYGEDEKAEQGCPRKWYYGSVLGQRTPTSDAALAGQRIHAEMEDWLEDASKVPPSPEGRALMRVMPGVHDHRMWIEQAIDLTIDIGDGHPVPFEGYIDLMLLRARKQLAIEDHKTMRNFRFAKTKEQLLKDVQMGVYSSYVFAYKKSLDSVVVQHNQVTRVSKDNLTPVVKTPNAIMTRAQAKWVMDMKVRPAVKMMAECAQIKDVSDVPMNLNACRAFGGCDYYTQCRNAEFIEALDAPTTVMDMSSAFSIWDRVDQINAEKAATAPKPAVPTKDGWVDPGPQPPTRVAAPAAGPTHTAPHAPTDISSPQAQPNRTKADVLAYDISVLKTITPKIEDQLRAKGVNTVEDLIDRVQANFKLTTLKRVAEKKATTILAELANLDMSISTDPIVVVGKVKVDNPLGGTPVELTITRPAKAPAKMNPDGFVEFFGQTAPAKPKDEDWMSAPAGGVPMVAPPLPTPKVVPDTHRPSVCGICHGVGMLRDGPCSCKRPSARSLEVPEHLTDLSKDILKAAVKAAAHYPPPLMTSPPVITNLVPRRTIFLYGCRGGGESIDLSQWLLPICQKVAADHGRPYWDSPGDNGDGRKALAYEVSLRADEIKGSGHMWVGSPSDPAVYAVVGVFRSLCDITIER